LRIALEKPMRADTLFLERAAIEINERVCLISADEDLNAQLHITEAGVRHVLGLLRQRQFSLSIYQSRSAIHPSGDHAFSPRAGSAGSRGHRTSQCHALRTAVTNIAGKDRSLLCSSRQSCRAYPRATIVKSWAQNQTW